MTSVLSRKNRAADLAIAGALFFIAAVAMLHVLRSEVDPLKGGMSFYAIGRFGTLMMGSFIALGVSQLALVAGFIRKQPPVPRSRAGLVLLAVSGAALLAVALFPSNAVPPVTRTDFAHVVASMIFFSGFAIASVLVSRRLRPEGHRPAAYVFAVGFGVTFLTLIVSSAPHGLLQRIAVGFALAWIVTISLCLRRHSS